MVNFIFLPIMLVIILCFVKQSGRNTKYIVTILLTLTLIDTILYIYKYNYTTIVILGN